MLVLLCWFQHLVTKNMEYGEDGGGRAMRNDEVMTGEVCTVAR